MSNLIQNIPYRSKIYYLMVAENHVTLCKHRELATMHREILLALGQIWIVAHQYGEPDWAREKSLTQTLILFYKKPVYKKQYLEPLHT